MHFATALFALAASVSAQSTLLEGKGFGTYYYDVTETTACGTDFTFQNEGSVMCSWYNGRTLDDINSDNLVAMSNAPLKTADGRALYCGKRVIVTVNGKQSDIPFFIGDGCERCAHGSDTVWNPDGAQGLDFSYSQLTALSSEACDKGHIDIQYEIVNETLYSDF